MATVATEPIPTFEPIVRGSNVLRVKRDELVAYLIRIEGKLDMCVRELEERTERHDQAEVAAYKRGYNAGRMSKHRDTPVHPNGNHGPRGPYSRRKETR